MSNVRNLSFALFASMPLLACSQPPAPPAAPAPAAPPSASANAPTSMIGRQVEQAIIEARKQLATQNISISDGIDININGSKVHRLEGAPKAAISPQGDLLIDGKAVAVTPAQRAELLRYRGHVVAIAEAGMGIGVQAADLASKAVGEALGAIFSGNEKGVEARIEAEAGKIEAHAMKICAQLPPLLATQQRLAVSLPAFKPYATMTQADIDDCGKDVGKHKGVAVTNG